MRILYLADAPYIHTRRLVEHFAGLGHDCEVISFRPADIPGVRVTHVAGFERLGKARYLIHARKVAGLIRERHPDVLHALHLTSYGFLAALSGYHPTVISPWGTDILEAPRLTPLHAWLTRFTLRRADEIAATGDDLARETARYAPPGRTVHSIPYGVDIERFRPRTGASDRGRPAIGTVSRLSPEKGVRHLIDAVARLALREDAVLKIAGDGPERAMLEARAVEAGIGPNTEFAGWLDHDSIPGFLESLDVYVQPSLFEGFGVAAVEAAAAGLPVIASRVNGLPGVVIDGVTGVLVPPGDAAALAAAIEDLVRDPEKRRRMGEAGRAFVAQHYDWRSNMAGLEAIYLRLAGAPARATP